MLTKTGTKIRVLSDDYDPRNVGKIGYLTIIFVDADSERYYRIKIDGELILHWYRDGDLAEEQ